MTKKTCFTMAVVLVMAAILGVVFAQPLWAQVRAALVRDIDAPALSPFRAGVDFDLAFGSDQRLLTTVPAGKRLVIEHISYFSGGDSGDQLTFGGVRNSQLSPFVLFLEIHPPHAGQFSTFQDGSQPVKAYFEAGEEIWVAASHNKIGGNLSFHLRAFGYLITP